MNPLVSIIIPTYNRPSELERSLGSVLSQTFRSFEVVVVNDAGTDVRAVLSRFSSRMSITYIQHMENRGPSAARNTAIQAARGKYITYLDDDDLYYPYHLETLTQFLEVTPYKVAYTDAYRIFQVERNGEYVELDKSVFHSENFNDDFILVACHFPILCVMHEKDCLSQVGCFDETLRMHEDLDLWIRMSRKYKFAHIKRVTAEFKETDDGISNQSTHKHTRIQSLQNIHERYGAFSSPFVRQLQHAVIRRMRAGLERERPF